MSSLRGDRGTGDVGHREVREIGLKSWQHIQIASVCIGAGDACLVIGGVSPVGVAKGRA